MKHTRYAVKTEKGYVRRKGSSYFEETTFDKADLYLTEKQANIRARSYKNGEVVLVELEECEAE